LRRAIVLIWLSFVGHQVRRWRRAAGERRQQQKWLALGAVATIAGVVLGANRGPPVQPRPL
jgi:hypothetical protein